jgi:hypothetical protein
MIAKVVVSRTKNSHNSVINERHSVQQAITQLQRIDVDVRRRLSHSAFEMRLESIHPR